MTTIAYRDGVMASDSGVWIGDAMAPFARKMVKGADGTLYGGSGNAGHWYAFMEWVLSGCAGDWPRGEAKADGSTSLLVIAASVDGPVKLMSAHGIEVYDAPYFAIGAGNVGALCAMAVGASAEEAIRVCCLHAPGAEGPVQAIRHAG